MRSLNLLSSAAIVAADLAQQHSQFAAGTPALESGYSQCGFSAVASNQQWYTFDLSPLHTVNGYTYTDGSNNTYAFNICGATPRQCFPSYQVQYDTANAMMYFGDAPAPGSQCMDNSGNEVPCTRNCEALGIGPASNFQLLDPSNVKSGGVQFSYYGVASLPGDIFACPLDPRTATMKARTLTFNISCNPSAQSLIINSVVETSPCVYYAMLESRYACGCLPACYGRNCGSDGCNGYCGNSYYEGACPMSETCTASGTCCKPDCRGRQCGEDGCGGSCGTCAAGDTCDQYQQCT